MAARRTSAIDRILGTTPVAVLVDRSRDACTGANLVCLRPDDVFRTTDSRVRLTAGRLAGYDILAICGNGTMPYTPAEKKAVQTFVRRGGSLLLAACSGAFEQKTGRPVDALAVNALARLFGFGFLSASDLPADVHGCCGFDRARLALTQAGKTVGLKLGEIGLGRPGPLTVPPGARVLMRAKRSGDPVIATARHGLGRVMACNDLGLWGVESGWRPWTWSAAHWLMPIVPGRRTPARRPVECVWPASQRSKRGDIVLHYSAATHRHADRVHRLVTQVLAEVFRIRRPAKPPKTWHIHLEPGVGAWPDRTMPEQEPSWHVGVDASDASIVASLAGLVAWVFFFPRDLPGLPVPMARGFALHVLRRLGHEKYAQQLEAACAGGKRVDLGRAYSEADIPKQSLRLWTDVAAEFGDDVLRKFARAVPRKDFGESIEHRVYSRFDLWAYYLARAVGERAYDWLESQGHTLRRIPLAPPNSDRLKAAQSRAVRKLLLDPTETASDRFDALCCLAGRLKRDKRSLDTCARLAKSTRLTLAVPTAAHLAQAKDQRGIARLRRWLRHADSGLAAISALTLVFEAFDKRAADVLVKLAGKQDVRFQLSAGYALRLAGDRRADRFAFENLDGCRMKVVQDGYVKAFSVVDGYETANTFCLPQFAPAGHGAYYSDYYVAWVHTDPHWRRRGLARLSFAAALDHRWHRTCAATSLHTGTRNVAHTLYRGWGLIDYTVHHTFHRKLHGEPNRRPPRGITIRRLTRSDLAAAGEMLNEYVADRPHARIRLSQLPASAAAYGAFDGRRLVGLALASRQRGNAVLDHLAVAKLAEDERKDDRKRRERTGEALLSALHKAMWRRQVKSIETNRWLPRGTVDDSFTRSLLRHCGYGLRREGLVEQRRVNDLARYFTETADALEKRLAANAVFAGWTGSVWIDGQRLRACLRFRHGRVTVTSRRPTQPTLAICGDQTAVERIAMGLATPFEESLQTQVTISPMLNASTTDLLETLFPCVVQYL
ncbi:MAG TPA: hypothetical protein VMZ31_13795 [Phycisphaerae bacterium]|nr:hypothetical protein [Phycisphaerae bacterium]